MERIQRVNQLIKKELSQIILREIDLPRDVLATVTRVVTSQNLNQVKVYISIMPENQSSQILEIFNQRIYDIQQQLNKRLKMRPIPRVSFIEETKTKEAGKIEELLEKIHKKNV